MKRLITIVAIVILLPCIIFSAWLTGSESGLRWVYQQAMPHLPVELNMEKLEGRLLGTITVTNLNYQQNSVTVNAGQINLQWSPFSLLTAKVELDQLHIQSLNIVLPPTDKNEPKRTQAITLPAIYLPWRVVLKDGVINGVNIRQNDQLFKLEQIRLSASTLFSQIDIDELNIKSDSLELNIKGELELNKNYPHKLATYWQVKLPSNAIITGKGKLTGDMKMSRLQQRVNGSVNAIINADLHNLPGKLNWLATVNVTDFNTEKLNANWPAISGNLKLDAKGDLETANIVGNINGHYPGTGLFDAAFKLQRLANNSFQIDQLSLHIPVSNTLIHARGHWLPGADGGDIRLGLDWENLRWPLKGKAWFDSAMGNAVIEGNLDHYQFELATDRPWSQAPPSTWYASAEGNHEGLTFHSLNIHTLKGEVNATGQLNWLHEFSWQAKVSTHDIDPASLFPQWPGQLKSQLISNGHIENGKLIAVIDVRQITGTLRGYPLSLHGQLHWHDNGFDIENLELMTANSKVNIDGRLAEELKLKWKIVSADLAELYPKTQGKLNANGLLYGFQSSPTIKATFNGQSLKFSDYKIGSINGTMALDLFQWQQLDINLVAQSLDLNGILLQEMEVISKEQEIKTKLVADKIKALISLKGKGDAQGWHGQIEQADFDVQPDKQNMNKEVQHWRLKQAVDLKVSTDRIECQSLCWSDNNSSLCLSAQIKKDLWQLSLNGEHLPMRLLSPWLPEDLKLNGVADINAKLHQQDNQISGEANIKLPPGELSYPLLEGERDSWSYQDGTIKLKLDQESLILKLRLAMNNGDHLQLDAELPEFQLFTFYSKQQRLIAEMQLNIHDLGLIEAMLPEVQDLQGEMAINLSATGTVSQPRISAKAHLLKGAVRIPRLGLTIDQLTLRGQTDNKKNLNFMLAAHSGSDPVEGKLSIQGKTLLDHSAGWPTEITVKGEQFEVSRIPEAQVQISPDLQINMQNNLIDIKGNVHIPYAKFQPKDITTAAHVSEDAVIVDNEQKIDEKWLANTKIRLTLGDRVHFYGFGFEGRFGGKLLLVEEPGQLMTATGELTIPEGRYRAYGQRLNVEHGRLLYTGGPISNPGLDMRAIRHIGNITAGINVRGSVNKPQLEIFSVPAMSQTDALAYLVLGRPLENASNE
ncbi:MAG: translocation/assembly module TamB domain-containing protein, partial [Gammaproteobacteria bacterium]|nr:translocation/assembly module TamB domain-containing protein [Gammaproteobacteria bacterium]